MPRALLATIALLALPSSAALASGSAPAGGGPEAGRSPAFSHEPARRYAPGELLVRFKPAAGAEARAAVRHELGARRKRVLPVPGLQLVRLRPGSSVRTAAAAFERDSRVLYAEPNFYYRLAAVPNDRHFAELWALNNSGQSANGVSGAADADIDAPEAWNVTTGNGTVTVAVADSGIAYDHPDLKTNIWTNPGESGAGRETNGRDDDRNGLTDDWRGWDFVSKDNDPRDLNGHGSHVAGTIGASGNNGAGVTGVNWRVRLMAVRVADGNGVLTGAAAIHGFHYAAAKGARIVNASFGSGSFSQGLLDAIRRNPKTLFVAAAGNGGEDGSSDDNDSAPQYPCNFSAPNVVCVAASDQADRLTGFSNYGARTVHLAAPGSGVLSAEPAYSPPVFSEGFENDISGSWSTGGPNNSWARITAVAHAGSYSLSDSPGATYLNNTDSFARTRNPFSLSGRSGCRLNYALRLSTEFGPDELVVEASRDGTGWSTVSELSGSSGGAFVELSDDLSVFDGQPAVYLGYHLTTNGSLTSDGAQLDEIAVRCLSSSYAGTEFAYRDGTSMAAPHVSGTAALIFGKYPTLGAAGVKDALVRGVDRKPSLSGKTSSGGRLNARRALDLAGKLVPTLDLSGQTRQRGAGKGSVVVYARCSQTCALVATGRLSVSGSASVLGLKKIARSAAAGRRKKLVLTFPRRARATARRALASRKRVTARVNVIATDRRGNSIRAKRAIKLKR
jgi:subtilisin family serine protease